ncbi:MAG: DNA mismatch repair endonuclease MutL [Dehalococcoidales bacterium]|nr:DNA mismatch repair endonuclease MutL [Dehalococcoidales bacterium]
MTIKVLDAVVVAQIAAGEVVERPASVVKELVENALDAGATQITVEIRGSGTGLIRVADNGSGIPAGEVELAFERHATSKVSTPDDLNSISTLGFRGEALASIAAVAEADLLTCAAGEAMGTHLSLKDGQLAAKNGQARSQGTTVTVRNLFRSVPARLKFLKSVPTENSHTANVVSRYALAFPEVAFSLFLEGKPTLRTPGSGQLIAGVIEVYGIEIAKEMLEIKDSEDQWDSGQSIKVSGLVGTPAVSRTSRNYISFFVNRRWITSRQLTWAVEEAYHGLLMQDKHPVAVININLPPSEVDANVHPTKTEVKFVNEGAVFGAVQKAVRRTVLQQTPIPKIEDVAAAYKAAPAERPAFWTGNELTGTINRMPAAAQSEPRILPILRVLGQAVQNYIVAEGNDGLYIIDQHAAHERIRYEQVKEQRTRNKIEVQGLLEAATFEVTLPQAATLKSRLKDLAEFGFNLEAFGERTYLVRAVPAILNGRDWPAALREMLDGLASGDKTDWMERLVMSMACHSAVRAGQALSVDEMRELVRQLEETAMPRTCPHGRPTVLHLSLNQLSKEFGRT